MMTTHAPNSSSISSSISSSSNNNNNNNHNTSSSHSSGISRHNAKKNNSHTTSTFTTTTTSTTTATTASATNKHTTSHKNTPTTTITPNSIATSRRASTAAALVNQRKESMRMMKNVDKVTLGPGVTLQGTELEDFCKKRGLCPLCAKTKIRRRVFKLFKKNKWEPLTVKNNNTDNNNNNNNNSGGYLVYKGYCVRENCFTLEQARTLAGEGRKLQSQQNYSSSNNNGSINNQINNASNALNNNLFSSQNQLLSSNNNNNNNNNTSMKRSKSRTRSVFRGSSNSQLQAMANHHNNNNNNGSTHSTPAFHNNNSNMTSISNHTHHHHHSGGGDADSTSSSQYNNNNNRTHKPHPQAFPPPGLKSTTNFEVHPDKPYFVIERTVQALQEDKISWLDLSNLKELRVVDFMALFSHKALRVNTTLTSLVLENCMLTDELVNILGEGLHEAKDIPLTKLYLRSNDIGDDGVLAICPYLEATVTLEKLDISRNHMSSKGAIAVFNAFTRNRLTRIRCINLSHNEIWNLTEDRFGIQAFLARNRTLQVLNLEANYVHDDGCEALTHGLLQNDQTSLECLYMGWNSIGDDGTIALAQLLESNTSLRVLGLGENNIKNAGARSLLCAMDYNTTLKEISGLWRNQIDRRFIIVAIRRLLLSPEREMGDPNNNNNNNNNTMAANMNAAVPANGLSPDSAAATVSAAAMMRAVSSTGGSSIEQAPYNNNNIGNVSDFDSGRMTLDDSVKSGGGRLSSAGGAVTDYDVAKSDPDYFDDDSLHNQQYRANHSIMNSNSQRSHNSNSSNPHNMALMSSDKDRSVKSLAMLSDSDRTYATGGMNGSASLAPVGESETPYDCLTVFQSAPLAYFDRESGVHKAIPLIDFRSEVTTIKEAVKEAVGAEIDVVSEAASVDRFTEFFTDRQGQVMHFTCYGHSDQVELENGYGSLQTMPVDGLRRLMDEGSNLRVVFVSSRNSRSIGQAFVDAGVPHVVCCQREVKYHDAIVSEFTHAFYRALANNKLLQQAFDIALKAVTVAKCSLKSRCVTERFCLLPGPTENNKMFHQVPVFFTQTMSPKHPNSEDGDGSNSFHFPNSPKNFVGREVDMYEILEALRVDDVVKIISPPGHGKDSVVAAVCEYAMQRRKIFSVDDIYWLPAPEGVVPEEDSLYGDLCLTINILKNSKEDNWATDEVLLECRERIEIELEDMQVVLVVDDRDFNFKGAQEGLEKFISYLLNSANAKVLLITQRGSEMTSTITASTMGSRIEEASIEIGPLDFKSTARLFGENSKFVASNGCPAAHSGSEFAELLEPAFISKMPDPSLVISERRSDLFVRMGNGLPSRVLEAADRMSKEDFIDLIGIANRAEVFVDSLGALEKELQFRKLQREKAIEEGNYMRAVDLDIILEELEGMRPEFPTLDDLREEESLMKEELAAAVKNRNYDTANDLKRELLTLKKKIMKERRLLPDNSKDANDRLNALQAQVQSMIEGAELTHHVDTNMKSATFAVHCDGRDCSFVIYSGEVCDFQHPSEAMGIVCWGNESCELKGSTKFGGKLLEYGGPVLEEDIAQLPVKAKSKYGPIRCGTGNALILGPEKYGELEAPCVVLSVGPLCPTDSQVDAVDDDTDSLHYITMMLRSCYRSSIVLARHAQLQALAISLLTTRKEGQAYAHTLRLGLQTLIEEVKFSHLRDLHVVASSQKEASILIAMMSEMGYRQIYSQNQY